MINGAINWEGFDVPENRKDIDRPENARWLLRNLSIRNSEHPRIQKVMKQIWIHQNLNAVGDYKVPI